MKKKQAKRAALAAWLVILSTLLSGCMNQISEREMTDLSEMPIEAGVPVPAEDAAEDREWLVTLYYLTEDGKTLVPVTRSVAAQGGESRAQAALHALLLGPQKGEDGAYWPDLGAVRSGRMLEIACGVATVDLPAHTRTLPQETLYAVRMAIAHTLTEFQEISYVNVLIGGREEGLDLGATLPVGTFTRVNDLDAGARYAKLHEQRQSEDGITVLTTLYFPSKDGRKILPEVRSMVYAEVSPIEYMYTILGELGKGAGQTLCAEEIPAPLEYIREMPEIVRTEDGYLGIELCFDRELETALENCGMTLGIYLAMLTDTLMGFVPGVEGLKVSIDTEPVVGLASDQTPDGTAYDFEQTLADRSDFSGCVGTPAVLYAMHEGGLARVSYVLDQAYANDARTRLTALMQLHEEGLFALPQGLTQEDVLAVHVGRDTIAVNLSKDFREAMEQLTAEREKAAVYAMVNTLTEDTAVSRVVFFFEGEQVEKLAGGLEMRGGFVRNPGMVVD